MPARLLRTSPAVFVLAGVIIVLVHFQIRPRMMIGEEVTVNFSKGTFINCLRNPSEVVEVKNVGLYGLEVTSVSLRLNDAFASADWRAGCTSLGIRPNQLVRNSYFVPFSVIASLQRGNSRFWSNALAT
jgi:hypothetical protein